MDIQLGEDKYDWSEVEGNVREALKHFRIQHSYVGPEWHGIELLHLHLAKVVKVAVIETPGWYSYPMSSRGKEDGKDWRYVVYLPIDGFNHTVVNCHSLVHDNEWTLVTTIFSTNEVEPYGLDELVRCWAEDPWRRSMMWSQELAEKLQEESSYDYSSYIADTDERMQMQESLLPVLKHWKEVVDNLYENMFGESDHLPNELVLGIGEWNLPKGKIASFTHEGRYSWGLMFISPNAFKRGNDFLNHVIKHELAHAAVGSDEEGHTDRFRQLATALGIPRRYQD